MQKNPAVYRDFPIWIVLYRALLLLATLTVGGIVSSSMGWIGLTGFILYSLSAILWTMAHACRNCAYHGHRCDLGVSLLATVLHPAGGTTTVFRRYTVTAVWLLAMMLAVPVGLGIAGLILDFTTMSLTWFIIYCLTVAAVIRTTALSCPHCSMRRICPLSFYHAEV